MYYFEKIKSKQCLGIIVVFITYLSLIGFRHFFIFEFLFSLDSSGKDVPYSVYHIWYKSQNWKIEKYTHKKCRVFNARSKAVHDPTRVSGENTES